MINIMLDLEALSAKNNAAILSIGAVKFGTESIIDRFYRVVSLKSCTGRGFVMDADTIAWWMKQSDEARKIFTEESISIDIALREFSDFVGGDVPVWGNGATFDNVIITSAFELCRVNKPWKFWNDKCYRTIKSAFPEIKLERTGTHHNALNDAESQAMHLIKINKETGLNLI